MTQKLTASPAKTTTSSLEANVFVKVLPTQLIGAHLVCRQSTLAVLMAFAKVAPKIVALVGMQQPARHVRHQTSICRIQSALNVP